MSKSTYRGVETYSKTRLWPNKALELTAVPASVNVAVFQAHHAIAVRAIKVGGSSA